MEVIASRLGYFIDGWADLVENMGSKAEEVREDVMNQLDARNMPFVVVERADMKEGIVSEKANRDYIITKTFPGVTSAICVARFGNDLYAAWRTFIRPTLNETYLLIYSASAISLVFMLGIITRGSWVSYLKFDISSFVGFMSSIQRFIQAIFALILSSIPVFISILILAAIAGFIWKLNIFTFILKEPSLFDQEDITAMSLTVHKTLLRSLDEAGIDVTKLRLKREYKSGRRGESV